MSSIRERLEIEKRTESNKNNIYLYISNNNFLVAYNWSAILCREFNKDLPENNKLKISHKQLQKDNIDYIQVGFPISSISKYLVGYNEDSIKTNLKDNIIIIKSNNKISDISKIEEAISKYINDTPIINNSKSKSLNTPDENKIGILLKIMNYQLEDTSDKCNKQFIRELKNDVSNIFKYII